MGTRLRRGQCGFRVLLSARLSPCSGVGPHPKVEHNKKTRAKEKNHNIQVLGRRMPLWLQNRVLFACPRVTVLLSRTPIRMRGCPGALFPLTRQKPSEVRAPSFQRSGCRPAPSRLPPGGPRSASQAAPPFGPWRCSLPTLFPGRMREKLQVLTTAGAAGGWWGARGVGREGKV